MYIESILKLITASYCNICYRNVTIRDIKLYGYANASATVNVPLKSYRCH